MVKDSSDAERDRVWAALLLFHGNRELAADELGMSLRTLNRRIRDYNLFRELDAHGLIRNAGPPRLGQRPKRGHRIIRHILKNDGEIDRGLLAVELYSENTPETRSRVYTALYEMKAKGYVAVADGTWFVVRKSEVSSGT